MFRIICTICGATALVPGSYDPETNATEVDDNDAEWNGGHEFCEHWNHYNIEEEIVDDFGPDDPNYF